MRLTEKDFIKYLTSFEDCVEYVFREIGLGTITTVQRFICRDLQLAYRNQENIIVEQFRGIGKSLITSIFAMWILAKNRDLKILVISGTSSKAKNFVRFCYLLMNKTEFFSIIKVTSRSGSRTSVEAFDVVGASPAQDPSLKSLGVTGTVTSARANIIIIDDMETKKNSRTPASRELLYEISTEFEALLTAGAKQFMVYLGTRHNRESIYHRIRDERGFKHFICPVLFPENIEELKKYRGLLSPHIYMRLYYNGKIGKELLRDFNAYDEAYKRACKEKLGDFGTPTDERFNEQEIKQKQLGMGKTAFDMQMMLRIETSEEVYPLSLNDILITNFPPTRVPTNLTLIEEKRVNMRLRGMRQDDKVHWYRDIGTLEKPAFTIMSIDPAGRGKDLFAYSIISVLHGRIYVHKVNGLQGGYKDHNLFQVIDECKLHRVNKIIIEDNFGDGAITQLLLKAMDELRYRVSVQEVKNLTNKVSRIVSTVEPLLNQHRVIFSEHVGEESERIARDYGIEHSLIFQLSWLVEGEELEHDDLLDSLSMGLGGVLDMGGGLSLIRKMVSMDGGVD